MRLRFSLDRIDGLTAGGKAIGVMCAVRIHRALTMVTVLRAGRTMIWNREPADGADSRLGGSSNSIPRRRTGEGPMVTQLAQVGAPAEGPQDPSELIAAAFQPKADTGTSRSDRM